MDVDELLRDDDSRRHFLCVLLIIWYYIREVRPRMIRAVEKRKRPYSMIEKIPDQIKFLDKLTALNDTHCYNVLRMDRSCFHKFCNLLRTTGGLEDSKYVSVVEKVASFLLVISHHAKHRLVAYLFERSCHTISVHFNEVLGAVLRLHDVLFIQAEAVKRDSDDPVWKYFEGCVGALDGTYIPVSVRRVDHARYRNRKGFLSVNVLGVCDHQMRFVHVLTGWEGSAADGRVLRDAISRPNGLQVAEGTYYLVDCGYANAPGFLAPFRSTRYHLKEWGPGNRSPQNAKEYFNMKHASARNVVERTFGILKKRWAILRSPSFYPIETQNSIILACCLIHNFIRIHMEKDPGEDEEWDDDEDLFEELNAQANFIDTVNSSLAWTNWRNNLSTSMYNSWRARRNARR